MLREFCTLGIDPGLAAMGLTVIARRGQFSRLISVQTVHTKASWSDAARFEALGQAIAGWARAVDLIVIEGQRQTWVSKMLQQRETGIAATNADALKLQDVVGTARGIALMAPRPFLVLEPREVQASLGVPPNAGKTGMQRAVRLQCAWGEVKPGSRISQHAWDAAGIAIAGERRWRIQRKAA